MTYTGQTPNARYGRIILGSYAALNGVLLVVVCAGAWILAARANSHGIAPNTTLGFRSEHTLTSLHGWYVAQRVGFHFVAVSATIITVAPPTGCGSPSRRTASKAMAPVATSSKTALISAAWMDAERKP